MGNSAFISEGEIKLIRKKLILALDVKTTEEAINIVTRLHPYVGIFKVGLELITSVGGPLIVSAIKAAGGEVFYDGKFNDIPNTVGQASKQAANLGVKIFNVHASSGIKAMMEAVKNRGDSQVFAVTVLTSIDEANSNLIFGMNQKPKVLEMAYHAYLSGCQGIICSGEELLMLSEDPITKSLKKIIPGIRPSFASKDDQQRIMTPREAMEAGADYLVIGRPITKPPQGMTCEQAAIRVLGEMAEGLGSKEEEWSESVKKETDSILLETKAVITNTHVVYTSSNHGPAYVNKDAIYPHTHHVSRLCKLIAETVDYFDIDSIDSIIGPVVGGVALSHWTAHHLSQITGKSIKAIVADKTDDGFEIKRGQSKFITGKNVIVVEDILNTGGSVKKVTEAVKRIGGEVVVIAALCNRGNVTSESLGYPEIPLFALTDVDMEMYPEEECPLCKNNVPINTSIGKGAEFLKRKSEQTAG